MVGTASFVTLTGTIKDDTDTVVSTGTIFSGDFGSTVVGFVTPTFATFGMGGTGTIDADLATEAGTGVVAEFGLTVLSVGVATGLGADGSFNVDLTDADFDLVLASSITPIPLPAPLAMLLLGVAGIGFAARRRA